ncbi:MAG: UTRA domain-containing protein [Streptosporangiales bacterium]|nr:UTRA domain-containing protein [Streptosporangiales bacterium]
MCGGQVTWVVADSRIPTADKADSGRQERPGCRWIAGGHQPVAAGRVGLQQYHVAVGVHGNASRGEALGRDVVVSAHRPDQPQHRCPVLLSRRYDDSPCHGARHGSLVTVFGQVYGLQPVRGHLRAEVDRAPAEVARRLHLRGRPEVIALQGRIDSRRRGRPIDVTRSWLRADVFRLVMEVGPDPDDDRAMGDRMVDR